MTATIALLALACSAGAPQQRAPTSNWEPLKVGAGGWVTGIDFCKAGTTYAIRTDTYGAYIGNPNVSGSVWKQIVRSDTMPASFLARMGDWLNEGVYEIRVAPSDCDRLYMMFKKKIYRSADRGATWTETAFSYSGAMDPNDPQRMWGEKMAVDPANPDVVYAGTPAAGMFVTVTGGESWRLVSGVPSSTGAIGITGIVFDESSGMTAGRTKTVYAASNGNGVYRSTDAGASWTHLAGGPTSVRHAAVASDGIYYAVDGTNVIYKLSLGTWSAHRHSDRRFHSVATDPFDPAHVVFGDEGGSLAVSRNRCAPGSWVGGTDGWIYRNARVAKDVPWLAFAEESYMSNGSMRFDPLARNKLWFAEGIGVWYALDPDDTRRTVWTSYSAGIEQIVGRDIAVPPGSANVIVAGMDRSIFVLPRANGSYPSRQGTEPRPSAPLVFAWAVNWAANDSSHLVALVNHGPELSGYSMDGGRTWTRFRAMPSGTSGDIAATNLDSIIAVIGDGYAWRSTDRGATWRELALPGATNVPRERRNLHCGYNCRKHILAIDGADPHTMYLHFHGHGIYRSTDDGATWALVSAQAFDGENAFWQTKLRSVPGYAGHLFLTAGQAGGAGEPNPAGTHLWRSTNGGVTWTRVPGMAEPYDVAVGKAAPAHGYPAIYVVGWYNGVYGIWRSIDDASTWTNIGPFPFNSFDEINVIKASQDVYGEVYVAFQGSGYGKLSPPPTAP